MKLPLYVLFRVLNAPTIKPFNFTYSITYRCNSRCRTCKIWRIQTRIKLTEELNSDEWQRIIKSIGASPFWITISGGEPFLRYDLLMNVVQYIIEYNKPKILNIPTNATLTLYDKVRELLEIIKNRTVLILNLSLDGIGKLHDHIRGVEGNWKMLLKNYEELKVLKEDYKKNFIIGVHTVLSKWNVSQFKEIVDYVTEQMTPDQYIVEVAEVRREMENFDDEPTPDSNDIIQALNYLIEKYRSLLKKSKGVSTLTYALRLRYYKYLVEYFEGKNTALKSYAGFASCHITPLGDVWDCAIYANKLGNLRDYNYDFNKLWKSRNAKKVRKIIKKSHKCILANEFYSNALFSVNILWKTFTELLKYRITGG